MKNITVTELARALSDLINRVNYRGESFTVLRGGKPVAQLTPAPAGSRIKDLPEILASLPPLDPDDLDAFATDLTTARRAMNQPVSDPWAS